MKVANLLESKGSVVWSVDPKVTVFTAIKLMDEKGIGAVAVVGKGQLVGILSERDYARKVILKDRASRDTRVEEIMTGDVLTVGIDHSVQDCMVIMTQHRIRHLPVMHQDSLIGMVSLGDVVRAIIEEQQIQIEHLEHTISWGESY